MGGRGPLGWAGPDSLPDEPVLLVPRDVPFPVARPPCVWPPECPPEAWPPLCPPPPCPPLPWPPGPLATAAVGIARSHISVSAEVKTEALIELTCVYSTPVAPGRR